MAKFLLSLFLLISIYSTTAQQPPEFLSYTCTNAANYTPNSTYHSNRNSLLSSLPSTTSTNYGFSNTYAGELLDTVNAIALCRGDVSRDICIGCLSNATIKLTQDCPNQMEAIGFYDLCMVRYSNFNISNRVDDLSHLSIRNPNKVRNNVAEYKAAFRNLTDRLQGEAAAGGSLRKFATGNTKGTDLITIYGLMQCTPDLSPTDCRRCLDAIMKTSTGCCSGRRGGRVIMPSCNLRFDDNRFYEEIPAILLPPPPPPPPCRSAGKSKRTSLTVILIASLIPGGMVLVILICVCMILWPWKNRRVDEMESAYHGNSRQFRFSTISSATDNFSESNKLGEGGFGPVYKGILPNGHKIAVKKLSKNSVQGEREFKNEVRLVSGLQHRNLVRLLGFSLESTERLPIVYEFVPTGNLDQISFDPDKRETLDWDTRCKIIGGIAKGLLYLHTDSRLRIIHCDLKASNVLLDTEMNAKIADFGMARLFEPEESQAMTQRIVGTYGYMPPEYVRDGVVSVKLDVYSFGVLLLEIVSGRKNNSRNGDTREDLPGDAWKSRRDGAFSRVIDPILTAAASSGSMQDMIRFIHIGLICVQENAADRPTMDSVVLMLGSSSLPQQEPSMPPLYAYNSCTPEMQQLTYILPSV